MALCQCASGCFEAVLSEGLLYVEGLEKVAADASFSSKTGECTRLRAAASARV